MQKIKLTFVCIIAPTIVGLFGGAVAGASVQDFYFSQFSADYRLDRSSDGTSVLNVSETLVAEFPGFNQNKGIERAIPRTNQGGKNLTFVDEKVMVTRNGQTEPIWDTEKDQEYFYISTGTNEYLRGPQTYGLKYQFQDVITEFDENGERWQELYWDTNGTDWMQRFDAMSATVYLSGEVADGYLGDAVCYTGRFGSAVSDCSIKKATDKDTGEMVITFTSGRALQAHENLTLALKFRADTFIVPEPAVRNNYVLIIITSLLFAMGIGLVVIFIVNYRKKVSRPRKRFEPAFTPVEYLPPDDISLLGAAQIAEKVRGGVITAELIDMAVRGKVLLVEAKRGGDKSETGWLGKMASAFASTRYSLEILDATSLSPDDRGLLAILKRGSGSLQNGDKIELNPRTATNAVGIRLQNFVQKTVYLNLVSDHFVNTNKSRTLQAIAVIQLMLVIASFIATGAILSEAQVEIYVNVAQELAAFLLVANVVIMIVLFVLCRNENKYANLTEKGYSTRNYLQGLREDIKMAESERIKFLQSAKTAERVNVDSKKAMVKLYEKLLPYAVLFGEEKTWAKQLEFYAGDNYAPTWYSGVGTFRAAAFVATLNTFSTSMSATYGAGTGSYSASGSGFSGGGFSGGGGGGGGGGGR